MEPFSGDKLVETFDNLGINTGNVSKLTIDSWFETDCERTQKFLQWLCHLGKENVLTPQENEEYELLKKRNQLLDKNQCKTALAQVVLDNPGILDYERNLFEVECKEDELEMLLEQERHLESVLNFNENLCKKLKKDINKACEDEITSTIKLKAVQDDCREFSYKLDAAHEKLQQQIGCYAEHLSECEYAARPMFLASNHTVRYDQYYSDISSYIGLFLQQFHDGLPKPKRQQDSDLSSDVAKDQLEIIEQRLTNSIESYICKQAKEEGLRGESKFLRCINMKEVMLSAAEDSSHFVLEASIFSKEVLLNCLFKNVANVAQQQSEMFLNIPKISFAQKSINIIRQKLDTLTHLDDEVTEILSQHMLLYLLFDFEKADMQSTDKFFRDVHHYITHTLRNCHLRTESMMDVINNYLMYKNLPIEKKFKILSVVKAVLTEGQENFTDSTAIEAVKSFNRECNRLEQQVFLGDYADHRRFSLQMHQDVEVMQKFLMSGPTSQMIIIPHKMIECFNKISEVITLRKASLKSALQEWNSAEKTLSENKWLRMRRQLWMWFMLEPKKVLTAIEQIEIAIKQKRKEAT